MGFDSGRNFSFARCEASGEIILGEFFHLLIHGCKPNPVLGITYRADFPKFRWWFLCCSSSKYRLWCVICCYSYFIWCHTESPKSFNSWVFYLVASWTKESLIQMAMISEETCSYVLQEYASSGQVFQGSESALHDFVWAADSVFVYIKVDLIPLRFIHCSGTILHVWAEDFVFSH